MSDVTTPPATTTPPAATTPPSAVTGDWMSGMNEDLKGYVQNKGFKDSGAVVDGYRNLEKLLGAPKERLLKVPEKYDDVDGWNQVYTKLGKPEKPEGYGFKAPPGGDENFVKVAKTMFHEAGLSNSQGEKLVEKWNGWISETQKVNEATRVAELKVQDETLKKEWGQAFDQNVDQGKKAAAAFGMTAEAIEKMEKAIGFAQTMKFFQAVGAKMGVEPEFATAGGSPGFRQLTPEGAKARIQELSKDPHFRNRYLEGEASAREEFDRLHRMAAN